MQKKSSFIPINEQTRSKFDLLPGSSIRVFLYLSQKLPRIFPKQTRIARDLHISDRTVRRAIKQLRSLKMIKGAKFYKCTTVYEINPELIHSEKKKAMHVVRSQYMKDYFARVAKEHGRRFYNAAGRTVAAGHNKNKDLSLSKNGENLGNTLRQYGVTLKQMPLMAYA